jgi:hypothetical protein
MKIKELHSHSDLSIRAYHVCVDLGLTTLEDLRLYYEDHKSFLAARNCGKKTNEELVALLANGVQINPSVKQEGNNDPKFRTKIKEIFDRFDISVRAFNVCQTLNLETLGDLAKYYHENGNFLDAKNCGDKTNKELIYLVKENGFQSTIKFPSTTFTLERDDQIVYNILIQREFSKLSIRCQNALTNAFGRDMPDYDLVKTLFIDNNLTGNRLSNVGKLTNSEVESFKSYCKALLSQFEGRNFGAVEKGRIRLSHICGFDVTDETFVVEFLESKLSVVKLLSKYFKEVFDLNEVDEFIAKNSLRLLDKKYSLDTIGMKFNLTRERIRQKSLKIHERLSAKTYIIELLFKHSAYPEIPSPIFVVDEIDKFSQLGSEIQGTSSQFAAYVLGVCNPKFYQFSPLDKFKRPDEVEMIDVYEEVKRVKYCYLIDGDQLSKDKLIKGYERLIINACQRRPAEQNVDWRSVLGFKVNPASRDIFGILIDKEFNLKSDESGVLFHRNTGKKVYEYALEALQKLDRPSHVNDICAEISKSYPDFDSTAISSSMRLHKNIFIYFGRSSTYGLKIWESKRKNIKGGTIKSIIEEYLEGFSEPKHLTDVLNYVRRFRDTTYNSVLTNLKLDTKDKFRFYGGGYIGLSSKTYSESTFGVQVKNADEVDWEKIIDLVF